MDVNSQPVIEGASFSDNYVNAVWIDPGTLPAGVTTWNNPDVVYFVPRTVTVPQGSTLTVSAGQIVKLARSIVVGGTMSVSGTAAQPDVFTSYHDNSVGGATIQDGNTGPARGDWGQIQFTNTSTNDVLNNVHVSYGGGGFDAEVEADGASPTITNSQFNNSTGFGLRLTGSQAVVTGDTFENNDQPENGSGVGGAIHIDASSQPAFQNLSMSNNYVDAVWVDPGTLAAGTTNWNAPGVVYLVPRTVTVPQGATLTVGAGQVIKLARSIVIDGTLAAQGTAAQPIIFTSYHDDSAGGYTVNDGNTGPSDGDWNSLEFTSTSRTSVLTHVEVRYGTDSSDGTLGMVSVTGATLTVSNSIIRNSGHCGIFANSGSTLTLTNDLVLNNRGAGAQAEASSNLTVINCTLDGNLRNIILDSPTAVLTNDLITNATSDGVFQTGPTNLTMSYCDVFNPGVNNYTGLSNQTNSNGNISADPHYFNQPGGQYELRPGSPAEDAGTKAGAPATDFLGNPRFKDPNLPGRGDGSGYDMGALEVQQTATSNIDLATTAVSGPLTGLEDQSVTVNWTVQSVGAGTATGFWHDAVYLSASPVLTPDAILLGNVQHTGDLGPSQSYNGSGTFTLPGVVPGNYYFIVRANSQNEIFEGANLANNAFASTATVAMDLPALTLGAPAAGQVATKGAGQLYKVTVAAGGNLDLTLTGAAGDTDNLFVSFGDVPTPQSFLARGNRPNSADQSLSLAGVNAGTYYVLVYGANVPSGGSFTVTASAVGFSLSGVSPTQGSNTGQVTISISGAQFDGNSKPQLVDSAGVTIKPLKIYYTDTGLVSATFDLTGLPTGPADVQVVNAGSLTQSLSHAFGIVAGQPGRLVTNLVAPSAVRQGRLFTITIEYANEGDTDIPAPIMSLTASSSVELSFSSSLSNPRSALDLVGVSPTGPAGVLAPGNKGEITIYGTTSAAGPENFQLAIGQYPAVPINWAAISPLVQPAGVSNAVWEELFAQIQHDVGPTWNLYQQAVSADATLLPGGLGLNYSLGDVLQLEVRKAQAKLQPSVSGQLFLNDASHPLGNVAVQLYESATGQYAQTVSLTDGSFQVPNVLPGTYTVTLTHDVMTSANQLTVGATGLSGVQLVAAPGAELTGSVVLAPGGAPAVGVTVSAASDTGGITATTTTDGNGRYVIDALPADTYDVTAGGGPYTFDTISGLTLSAGQTQGNVELVLANGGTISGTVTGPGGLVAGAAVSAIGADGNGFSAVSGSDGTFTIAGLSGQVYTVGATAPGLVAADIDNVSLTAGGTVTGVHLTLTRAGSLSGQLTSSVDGSPAPSVVLTFQSGVNKFTAVSDTGGKVSVSNLPPGTYTITTADSTAMTTSTTATVSAGVVTSFTLVVAPPGQVSGTVTNATTGKPLANVVVYAANAGGLIASTVADSNGAYQLTGFDAGTYQIVVGDLGSPGVARSAVTLSSGHTTATANFNVNVAGIVSGTVFQAGGVTPISGAQVALAQSRVLLETTTTDANGNYSFVLVAAGSYQLEAASAGVAFPAITGVALSGGAVVAGRNFVAGSQVIDGVVHDAGTAQPIAGAIITVTRADAGLTLTQVATLTSGADGSFQVTGLTPGSYHVLAQAAGYAAARQTLTVTSGTAANATFNLSVGSTLEGTIRDDATGASLANAAVTLVGAGSSLTTTIVTDATGSYEFGGLATGAYSLVVTASGYETVVAHQLAVGQGVNPLNEALGAATTQISGTITNGATPLDQVTVTATDSTGLIVLQTTTAFGGTYQLSGLPPGTYQLVATAAGYAASAPLSSTVAVGQTVANVNFALSAVCLSDPIAQGAAAPAGDYSWVTDIELGPPVPNPTPTVESLGPPTGSVLAYYTAVTAIDNANQAYERWQNVATAIVISNALDNFASLLGQLGEEFGVLKGNAERYSQSTFFDDSSNDIATAVGAMRAGDFNTAIKFLSKLRTDLERDFARIGGFFSGLSADELQAIAAPIVLLEATTQALEGPLALFAAYRKAEADFNSALANAQQAIGAYSLSTVTGGTLTGVLQGVITVVGAPVVKLPPPGDPAQPVQSTFNPVESFPSGPPIVAPVVTPGNGVAVNVGGAYDPNNLIGPAGYGPQGFIQPGTFGYEVAFENDPTKATAAAQVVTATLNLNADLDPSTFQFTGFGFASHTFTVPPGLTHYQTTIDLRPDGVDLLVPVTMDLSQGVVTVKFQSLDPATMLPPDGLNSGFLPIDDAAHDGEGFFTYTVAPKAGLPSGTAIGAQASIVFDTNTALKTPTALNTLDVGAPTSTVAALPAQSATSFTVSWSGSDDANGSGIAFYDVFVSDNGGPVTAFQTATTQTSATFTGVVGHTYGFYSVATDNVGNRQPTPTAAQATTTIAAPIVLPVSSVAALPAMSESTFHVSWSGSDTGGPGIASFDVYVSDNGGPFTVWLTGTTQTSATYQGTLGHGYGFYSVATDAAAHRQTTPSTAQATTQAVLKDANGEYVASVYLDVLARLPDLGGLAYWTNLLDGGTTVSSVAEAIAHSDEYYANFVIKPDYLKLLGRAADDAGVKYWTGQMDAGLTDQTLEAGFAASDEFFQNAGGKNVAWIDAVYKLLLGRTADSSGETYWNHQLLAGATRLEVAMGIAGSQENNTQLINEDYFHYLGRAADPGGLAYWLQQFAAGHTNEDLIAGFTGSAEYYKEHTP
ncbi:MAG TPA: carboxypeptidase regulatory-like domain-containing protein [Pirellulales bacterium]|jgi:hypothetical protein|nr:carboxypeptidase regulatory-like domain-containing protein [Pirellulales bacterium]